MATEFRHRLRQSSLARETARFDDPRDEPDPAQTGPRARLTGTSAVLARAAEDAEEENTQVERKRSARPSIRPSAFGLPRTRHSGVSELAQGGASRERHAPVDTKVERPSSPGRPPARASSAPPAEATSVEVPRVSQTVRKRAVASQPAVKADIEELLPISQGVKSLPRPPRLPTFEAPAQPARTTRRFPVMSLSIFGVVLAASLLPLSRYRGERSELATRSARQERVAAQLLTASFDEPSSARDALLVEGERALARGDAPAAERLFVRALEYGFRDPGPAYGLARVRLLQGDLEGARAWARSALERGLEDARYRELAAELSR